MDRQTGRNERPDLLRRAQTFLSSRLATAATEVAPTIGAALDNSFARADRSRRRNASYNCNRVAV